MNLKKLSDFLSGVTEVATGGIWSNYKGDMIMYDFATDTYYSSNYARNFGSLEELDRARYECEIEQKDIG